MLCKCSADAGVPADCQIDSQARDPVATQAMIYPRPTQPHLVGFPGKTLGRCTPSLPRHQAALPQLPPEPLAPIPGLAPAPPCRFPKEDPGQMYPQPASSSGSFPPASPRPPMRGRCSQVPRAVTTSRSSALVLLTGHLHSGQRNTTEQGASKVAARA